MASKDYTIRAALVDDAESIFAIMRQVLKDHLLYTIYQAPSSVQYLRELIRCATIESAHHLFVIGKTVEVLGYYHAINKPVGFFLNYIAVGHADQRRGLGNRLFQHYQEQGVRLGCHRFALDVFKSSEVVRKWYMSRGFRADSVSLVLRLPLRPVYGPHGDQLEYSRKDWMSAIEEEEKRGFSKVDCLSGSGFVSVGLIAGRACKLLKYEGVTLDEAIGAIMERFYPAREELIVTTSGEVPGDVEVASSETVLRLTKSRSKNLENRR